MHIHGLSANNDTEARSRKLKRQKRRSKKKSNPYLDKSQHLSHSSLNSTATVHSTFWYTAMQTPMCQWSGATAMRKRSRMGRKCSSGASVRVIIGWIRWLATGWQNRRYFCHGYLWFHWKLWLGLAFLKDPCLAICYRANL